MPLDGARPHLISPALPKAPPLSFPQTQRQQLFCCGLGQDGRAVAEGERSGGPQENAEDDPAAVTQSHDREHAHVHRWRRDATTRRNGPIGPRRGDALGPPTLAHPPHCHIWTNPPPLFPFLPQSTDTFILVGAARHSQHRRRSFFAFFIISTPPHPTRPPLLATL